MFRVQKRMCKTCIYKPTSTLNLAKLEADVADPHMKGYFKGHRICHHSKDVCCRGFWEKHKNDFTAGQIAQRLNAVQFVDVDTLKESSNVRLREGRSKDRHAETHHRAAHEARKRAG